MQVAKSLLLVVSVFAFQAFAPAETVEGPVKSYVRGKEIVLTLQNASVSFQLSKSTKFLDVAGKEWPGLDDPKDGIWSVSQSVTVKYHKKGSVNIADYVQFPYGKVDPSLLKKGDPGEPENTEPDKLPVLKIKEGGVSPEYQFQTFSGKKLSNRSLRGKVVVLDFWATWCGPCKMMSPVMEKLHRTFAKKGVVVIGVSMDANLSLAKDYALEHKYTFEFAGAGKLPERIGISGIPLVLVIDQKGIIRHIHPGFEDSSESALIKQVSKLLAKGQ